MNPEDIITLAPLEAAAAASRDLTLPPLKRARDIIGCNRRDISAPLTTKDISTALSEVKFFVDQLPFHHAGKPAMSISPEMAVHIAVVWRLARALVDGAAVEIVGS